MAERLRQRRSGGAANAFTNLASDLGADGGVFLKFSGNTGDFLAGSTGDEVPHGTQFIAMMDGLSRGHICWVDNEVVDEVMVRIIEGSPKNSISAVPILPWPGSVEGPTPNK
jgi:hypothetical protein